jgi:hypothetical protein
VKKILVLALLVLVNWPPAPARADAAEEERKLSAITSRRDQLQRDFDRHCSEEGLKRAAHEYDSKNQLRAHGSWWSAAFQRAGLRIKCGTVARGEELFMCQAKAACADKNEELAQVKRELANQAARTPLPPKPRTDIPPPPPPKPTAEIKTINVKDLPDVIASTPRTGQRPTGHTSSLSECGVPSTIEIKGSPSAAVLRYRRGRMFKQALYDHCIGNTVSDQDRQACTRVVKPMAMSDLKANGAYLATHPAASEFFKCLKGKTSLDVTDAQLAAAEADCRGEASLTEFQQRIYLGDLPDCRLGVATSDASGKSLKSQGGSSSSGSAGASGSSANSAK